LDPLRLYYECFILFDRETAAFRIMAPCADADAGFKRVQSVAEALHVVLCECATRRSDPVVIYLVQPPSSDETRQSVQLIDSDLSIKLNCKVALLTGNTLGRPEIVQWEAKRLKVVSVNIEVMRRTVASCLSRLIYYRGRVHIRTHIGWFLFEKLLGSGDVLQREDFLDAVPKHNTKGVMERRWVIPREGTPETDIFQGQPGTPLTTSSLAHAEQLIFSSQWISLEPYMMLSLCMSDFFLSRKMKMSSIS
jgi:hypothetical protein